METDNDATKSSPRLAANTLAERQASELAWHEKHPELGEEYRTNRYKKLVLERARRRQWELLGDLRHKRVLEIGCGVGRETVQLARKGARVVAIDISPTILELAKARVTEAGVSRQVEFHARAAEDFTECENEFDVVWGNGVLHHIDLKPFRRLLHRLLKSDGVAQFHEPLIHNPLLRLYRFLTPHLRTPAERPLSDSEIEIFVAAFSETYIEYQNLVGLALFPVTFLLGSGVCRTLLSRTSRIDQPLLARWPMLRRHCQYVLIHCRGSALAVDIHVPTAS